VSDVAEAQLHAPQYSYKKKCTLSPLCPGRYITRQNIPLSNGLETMSEPRALWALRTQCLSYESTEVQFLGVTIRFLVSTPPVTSRLFIYQVREMKYLRPFITPAEMCDLRSVALNSANDICMQITVRYACELKEWCTVRSESRCALT
jgi:hypothetical protein